MPFIYSDRLSRQFLEVPQPTRAETRTPLVRTYLLLSSYLPHFAGCHTRVLGYICPAPELVHPALWPCFGAVEGWTPACRQKLTLLCLLVKCPHTECLEPFPKPADECGTQNTIRAPSAISSLCFPCGWHPPTHSRTEAGPWHTIGMKAFSFCFILISPTKTP